MEKSEEGQEGSQVLRKDYDKGGFFSLMYLYRSMYQNILSIIITPCTFSPI